MLDTTRKNKGKGQEIMNKKSFTGKQREKITRISSKGTRNNGRMAKRTQYAMHNIKRKHRRTKRDRGDGEKDKETKREKDGELTMVMKRAK
eukprot:c31300_g1_i1 orf=51-323(+)